MENNKIEIEIHIDKEVYEQSLKELDDFDDFIELKLREYLNDSFSEEINLMRLIQEKITELTILEDKLFKAREFRLKEIHDESIYDAVMITIRRIHDHHGFIGKNQIKQLAKRENIPYDALLNHVRKCGLKIVNYT